MQNQIAINSRHQGEVIEEKDFGVVVQFGDHTGLMHVSELCGGSFVARGRRLKELTVGTMVVVEVIKPPQKRGKLVKISLGEKNPQNERVLAELSVGTIVAAEVAIVKEFGAICTILNGPAANFDALYHIGQVPGRNEEERKQALQQLNPGDKFDLEVIKALVEAGELRIGLSLRALARRKLTA